VFLWDLGVGFALLLYDPLANLESNRDRMAFRSLFLSTLAAQACAVWLAGVNIAGCEIGIDTSVNINPSIPPQTHDTENMPGQLRSKRFRKPVRLPVARHGEDSNAALHRRRRLQCLPPAGAVAGLGRQ
jgi:hypothetical protein